MMIRAANISAAHYIRMSTGHQTESPERQRDEVRRFCANEGIESADEYIDEAVSGTSIRGRPQFRQMLADAKAGKFAAVVF